MVVVVPSEDEMVKFVAPRGQMGIISVALDRVAAMMEATEPFREAGIDANDLRDLAAALRPLAGWSAHAKGEAGS